MNIKYQKLINYINSLGNKITQINGYGHMYLATQ